MQEYVKTISLQASDLTWDDVDSHARSIGFKDRSRYIQYLAEKDIHKSKRDLKANIVVIMLLVLGMLSLAILLKVMSLGS